MENVVEMEGITKEFPGVVANDSVDFDLRKGEIHALLGENGAGKSTLMSILFGLFHPDTGTIRIHGQEAEIKSPRDATRLRIGMVHQHFKLVHNFTVAENIVLGEEETRGGLLTLKESIERIKNLSEKYKLKVDPDAKIEDISVGQQQRVEILKMLYREADILILDEPTAVLTPQEIDELIKILRSLAKEGKSIILITHKLKEIKLAADRCTVLRLGKKVGTVDVGRTSNEDLAEMMVGREVSFEVEKKKAKVEETVLEVKDLEVKDTKTDHRHVKNMGFEVRKGEILCIAGIEGNGQTELVQALVGLRKATRGRILFHGEDVTHASIRKRSLAGMSHIPEDRQRHGLVLDYPLEYNLVLQEYFQAPFSQRAFLQFAPIRTHADALIENFDIRSGKGALSLARNMSGGNQQKAIVAREMSRESDLLIAVQPTRGLDVGAIEFIHDLLVQQRDEGKAVLLISLDLYEVMNLSDRIIVIYEGENVGEFDPEKVTERELGLYMSGSKRREAS